MFLDIFIIARVFNILYTWLEHNIIDNFLNFSKVFGNILILISVVIFLLILAYITIKHLKNLPKFYSIVITDLDGNNIILDGNNIILDGLRTKFTTYDAAKSYSEFYREIYKQQYKFYVVGSNKRDTLGFLDVVTLPHKAFKAKR